MWLHLHLHFYRAINAALRLKEDTSVKNSRQRARKWGAERIQLLSSGLTKPTGERS